MWSKDSFGGEVQIQLYKHTGESSKFLSEYEEILDVSEADVVIKLLESV
jgi:hypothetical protein